MAWAMPIYIQQSTVVHDPLYIYQFTVVHDPLCGRVRVRVRG